MTQRLDEKRPYGTIHPPLDGAHYEQDGRFFDHEGLLMSKDAGADKGAAKSAPSSSEAKTTKTTPATTTDGDLDIDAWARGEVNGPWYLVKKAALAKYPGITTANAIALKEALGAKSAPSSDESDEEE